QSNTSAEITPASPDAIHRSLLTGLLANCAYLDKNNKYKAAGGKEILIFPGSTLAKKKTEWIMCHEIVETSRVFARTVTAIQPRWLEELAADFCKHTFEAPFFDAETGYVRATERVTIFGMPLAIKKNSLYCKVDPDNASDIFIREGLVEENINNCHHKFYEYNNSIKEKILTFEDKLRSRGYYSGDDAIFDFYKERLPRVASINDLNKAIKAAGSDKFLFMKEEDILDEAIPESAENFPDHVNIGNQNFALRYAFEPGSDNDGVTLALPQKVLPFIDKESLGWLLPALWPDRIKNLLQQLPRSQRKVFIPMAEAAERLASSLTVTDEPFSTALSKAIKNIYKTDIDPTLLESERADEHLDLKIEVRDNEDKIVAKGRSGDVFKQIDTESNDGSPIGKTASPWDETFASYQKTKIINWPPDDLNKPIDICSQQGGIAVKGFPALVAPPNNSHDNRGVDLMYFPSKAKSDIAHRGGVYRLLELTLEKDFAWIERDISLSKETKMILAPFGTGEEFKEKLYEMIHGKALDFDEAPRSEEKFNELTTKTRESLRGIGFYVLSIFEESLRVFTENISCLSSSAKKISPNISDELTDRLNNFLADILDEKVTLDIFLQYPRYLRTFASIIEKASCEPFKYRQKMTEIDLYRSIHNDLRPKKAVEENQHRFKRQLDKFAQMIREYEISHFAPQHIKTLYPISEKRLDKAVEELKTMVC
ncbi:MAG: DUF3418 domain-containing protein, partial [Chitinispirillales bacterium]|nr:DUF3418 domain-containing protein [Chitinispirillales bacterium]